MHVFGITNIRRKRTFLLKALLMILLILTLVPVLFGNMLSVSGQPEQYVAVPGEAMRVSAEAEGYLQSLLTAFAEEAGF